MATENLISANFDADHLSIMPEDTTNRTFFTHDNTAFFYMENNTVIKEILNPDGSWAKTIYTNENFGKSILGLSADDSTLLTVDANQYLKTWNTATMTEKIKLNNCKTNPFGMRNYLSPKGSYIVQLVYSQTGVTYNLVIWSLSTGNTIHKSILAKPSYGSITFAPNEEFFVVYQQNFEGNTETELRALPGNTILYNFPKTESNDPVLAISPSSEAILFLRDTNVYKLSINDYSEEMIYAHDTSNPRFSVDVLYTNNPDEIIIVDTGKWNEV